MKDTKHCRTLYSHFHENVVGLRVFLHTAPTVGSDHVVGITPDSSSWSLKERDAGGRSLLQTAVKIFTGAFLQLPLGFTSHKRELGGFRHPEISC